MAKRLVKCLYCGQTFDANSEPFMKPKSNRYAHLSCAQAREEEQTQVEQDKEILENYIKELFGISSITQKIQKQIDTCINENNYTYSGIYKTLKYFFEIRGNDIERANGGIGIVFYVYEEACNYYRAIWEAQQKNIDVRVEDYVKPAREVHISAPKREPMRRFRKLFTFLEEGDSDGKT